MGYRTANINRQGADHGTPGAVAERGSFPAGSFLAVAVFVVGTNWLFQETGNVLVLAICTAVGFAILNRVFDLGLLSLSVVACPFMFYAPIAGTVNLSVVDFLLPFLILLLIFSPRFRSVLILRSELAYVYAIILVCSVSILLVALGGGVALSVSSAVLDTLKLGIGLALFLSLSSLARDAVMSEDWQFLHAWSATAVGVALAAVIPFILGDSDVLFGGDRATGTFEDPNLLSFYLVLSAGIVAVWNYQRFSRYLGLFHLVLFGGVVASQSRTGLVAFVLMIVFLAAFSGVRSVLLLAALALVSGLLWKSYPSAVSRVPFLSRFESGGSSIEDDYRGSLWRLGWDLWRESPIMGVGIGQFRNLSRGVTSYEGLLVVHNTFLSFLAEVGIIGLVAFCSIFVYFSAWLASRLYSDAFAPALFSSFICGSIMMFTLNVQNARFLWAFLAVASGLICYMRATGGRPPRSSLAKV